MNADWCRWLAVSGSRAGSRPRAPRRRGERPVRGGHGDASQGGHGAPPTGDGDRGLPAFETPDDRLGSDVRLIATSQAGVGESFAERLDAMAHAYMDCAVAHPALLDLMHPTKRGPRSITGVGRAAGRGFEQLFELIGEGQRRGEVRTGPWNASACPSSPRCTDAPAWRSAARCPQGWQRTDWTTSSLPSRAGASRSAQFHRLASLPRARQRREPTSTSSSSTACPAAHRTSTCTSSPQSACVTAGPPPRECAAPHWSSASTTGSKSWPASVSI